VTQAAISSMHVQNMKNENAYLTLKSSVKGIALAFCNAVLKVHALLKFTEFGTASRLDRNGGVLHKVRHWCFRFPVLKFARREAFQKLSP